MDLKRTEGLLALVLVRVDGRADLLGTLALPLQPPSGLAGGGEAAESLPLCSGTDSVMVLSPL